MTDTISNPGFKSGYVAIIGRPNVGKSTLINRVLGQKLCITSRRPQTTRHRILGVKTSDDSQLIYVDTPGIHISDKRAMNRYMNRAAASSIDDVDVILFVVDGMNWTEEDENVLERLKKSAQAPVLLVINKVDKLADKEELLPHIDEKYRSSSTRLLAGHSFGGLFALHSMLNKPKLFNAYLAVSPSMWWDEQSIYQRTESIFKGSEGSLKQTSLYLSLANETGMKVHDYVELIKDNDDKIGAWSFDWFKDESHMSTPLIGFSQGLKRIFSNYRIESISYFPSAKDIDDFGGFILHIKFCWG